MISDPVSPFDRKVSLRSGKNCRVYLSNPLGTGPLRCESWFEAQCAIYLMSHRDVVDISCQHRVAYRLGRYHYFDFRVTYRSGFVQCLAARPHLRTLDGKLQARMKDIRNYELKYHADDCAILTDAMVTPAIFLRSAEILRARSLKNENDCVQMRRLLPNMSDLFQVNDVLKSFERRGAARIAMWNLIDEGLLEHATSRPELETMTNTSYLRQCA